MDKAEAVETGSTEYTKFAWSPSLKPLAGPSISTGPLASNSKRELKIEAIDLALNKWYEMMKWCPKHGTSKS